MPRKYNLTLFRPDHPRFRIMDSHLEVMASLQWGLQACGLDCTVHVNQIDPQRTNIVFGWIIAAQMGALAQVPADTILYNFEQFSERQIAGTGLGDLAQRFQIWDYSAANLPRWQACNPRHAPFHAPVSFAPNLERVRPAAQQDIDLLYIGSAGPGRSAKLAQICTAPGRPALVSLQNVWAEARDGFIGRSKLLLNLSNDDPALRIFEVVRVSYYLANRKAVVCEDVPGQHVEDDLRPHLLWVPRDQLADRCAALLADPAALAEVGAPGPVAVRRRDVRDLIRQFFA
ncbi:MAG: hypothetical protein QE285_02050 [Aquabacterium sp.]|nr:hypothetical protein [Aquabacterium sp.]